MEKRFYWNKKFFSSTYNVYSNGQQNGNLTEKSFSQTAFGELNGKKYIFKTKGFFNQITEIIDASSNKIIGNITFNNWMTKANISTGNKTYLWKYDNAWGSKWSIYNSEGLKISYFGYSSKGQIDSNTDDELLLLTGLFVTNYYWQTTVVVLIAVIVPLMTVFT